MYHSRLSTVVLAVLGFVASHVPVAFAQPGAAPPPASPAYPATAPAYQPAPPPAARPSAFHPRSGLMIGFGVGVGDMTSERSGSIDCLDCEHNPLAAGGDLHIGVMIGPRFALMLESWATAKTLDSSGANTLVQFTAFAAARYWVTPRVWLQGGLGVSHLSLHYDDGVITDDEAVADGGALMGGLGYELRNEPGFTVDLQLKLASATYDGIDDSVNTGSLGIGLNWY